jgi:hypothetical protein
VQFISVDVRSGNENKMSPHYKTSPHYWLLETLHDLVEYAQLNGLHQVKRNIEHAKAAAKNELDLDLTRTVVEKNNILLLADYIKPSKS